MKPETLIRSQQGISRREFLSTAVKAVVGASAFLFGIKADAKPSQNIELREKPSPILSDRNLESQQYRAFLPMVDKLAYTPDIFLAPSLTPDQISAIEVFKNDQGELIKPPLHALTETEMANLEPMIAGLLAKKKITQPQADYLRGLYDLCFNQGGMTKISETMEATLPGPGVSLRNKNREDFVGPAVGFLYGFQQLEPKSFLITLQLEPGVLDPIKNPEKFWVARMGKDSDPKIMMPTQMLVGEVTTGKMVLVYNLDQGDTYQGATYGVDSWSAEELAGIFGAIPGAPVFIDRFYPQAKALFFAPLVTKFPDESNGLGTRFSFKEVK